MFDIAKRIRSSVERGAGLLDREEPDWHLRVSRDRLAMETCDRCILGQLYGGYTLGYESLRLAFGSTFLFRASDHGFTLPTELQDRSKEPDETILARFRMLANAWRLEIEARLK